MTDPRRLSEAAIAAIGERAKDTELYRGASKPSWTAHDDRMGLLAHAAYLAERMGEAEDQRDAMQRRAEAAEHDWQEAEAQLATLRADHAATVAELTERLELADSVAIKNVHYWQGLLDKERSDHGDTVAVGNAFIDEINKERAARLAAEGQVAELRMALEKIVEDCPSCDGDGESPYSVRDEDGSEPCGYCETARLALAATPSGSGAAAVLAAAEAETLAEEESDACRSGPRFLNSDRKQEILGKLKTTAEARREAVAAWREARDEQGGTK